MGDPKGFLKYSREEGGYRPVEERIEDYSEVEIHLDENKRKVQASRCMDCGVPFCHWACPVGNVMPEWQDMIFKGDWKGAYDILSETNNFPEFTGRVCPAPCEASCVLAIDGEAVTIRHNELSIIERAFDEGYVSPNPPEKRTGKKVAVIGGGPAGLACADNLNRAGHSVTLFEGEESVGGYLRFGIPDFKLEKKLIDRRINILKEEGIEFKTGVMVGKDIATEKLRNDFDALCLTIGAREPRDLKIEGRDCQNIHFAMEYLAQQNRIVRGDSIPEDELINALNKHVIVIGGGDTGADCVGSANRQGAASITQLELMPIPPRHRTDDTPWPLWPRLYKTSSSHEEGCTRLWSVQTKKFLCVNNKVKAVSCMEVDWSVDDSGKPWVTEKPGTGFDLEADIVLLAMGFVHPVHEGPVKDLALELDDRGNIKIDENSMTSVDGVFSAGDSSRGASLVVWAIQDGREAASAIDRYLSN